jgi:phosphoribosylformylglycinamidine (FGAM) synthase PurS component
MTIQTSIASTAHVVAIKDQVSSSLAEEAVILDLKSGKYYGLNPVGASIWSLIQQPITVAQIKAALLAEYEVDAETCEQDLQTLLQDLLSNGLIEVSDEAVA